ncbi:hypothetical protein M2447_001543 [Ereboglobus sp. PH5-10]|uniref:hypothetical protein n=1 Tax=Ereboglobus sp. PH5-10 TaxID=2940629 RepID=UPI0024070B4E|nr:hypothetical protein [Ereboglobus sp. PH5-10]MDF9827450.1 hypothetical protein [Ereboglobus sp. PH5-10]
MKKTSTSAFRIVLLVACGFVLSAFRMTAVASTPLINLVGEDAAFVMIAHDAPKIVKSCKDGPWLEMWNDDQIKRFLAPLHAKLKSEEWDEKVKAKTGLTIEELLGLVQGDYLIALKSMPANIDKISNEDVPLIIAAEIGDNKARVEKLIATLVSEKSASRATDSEDYAGVTINIIKNTGKADGAENTAWAIVDKTFLLSPSKAAVISTIDAIKNGGAENAFGKSERYLRMRQRTGDAQVMYAVNFQAIYPAINAAFAKKAASGGRDAAYVDYTTLASVLGFNALKDIYFGANYGTDNVTASGAITYTERRGLLSLLTFGDGAVKIPEYASADWPTVSVVNYSIPRAFTALEQLLEAVNPGVSMMIQGQLESAKQRLGIDIKRDLVETLGEQIVSANILPAGVTANDTGFSEKIGVLYVISLKDARTFQNAIETLKRSTGLENHPMLVQREYLGNTITTINTGAKQVSYTIARNQLVVGIGSPTIVEFLVQNLANGTTAPLAERNDVRENFAAAPADTVSFSVQNTAFTFRLLCDAFAALPQLSEYLDSSATPGVEFFEKHFGNSYGWMTSESDGLYFTSKMFYKK